MSAQTVSTCVVCGAQTDAFLCGDARRETGCLGLLIQRLGDCAWISEQLDTTLSRQDKVSAGSVGFVTGTAEKPLPLNLGASDASARLRDILCSWVRDLWETNAPRTEDGPPVFVDADPTIISTSRWLMRHPTWIALHPAADELHGEISEAIYQARRSVDIPQDTRVFVGKCGFELNDVPCVEELYARAGQDEVDCHVCGTWWSVEERLTWLLGIAPDQAATSAVLSRLLCGLGMQVGEKDIQKMGRTGAIVSVGKDPHGRRSYLVGEVLQAFLKQREPAAA